MIILSDTHTHLYAPEFDSDRDEMLRRAEQYGVKRFFLPNIDDTSIERLQQMLEKYPHHCFGMMGLHPCSVNEQVDTQLELIKAELDRNKYIAIGEIGIDLYWDKPFIEAQKKAFKTQCLWALERDLPVSIHCRNAINEIFQLLEELKTESYKDKSFKGIFHCFSGTKEEAQRLINYGFYLGIGGVLTYKNSGLAQVIADIDLKYLVLETDAPYLSPVPMRGKRNEAAYLRFVAEKLAEIKQCSLFEVAEVTNQNSIHIFGV